MKKPSKEKAIPEEKICSSFYLFKNNYPPCALAAIVEHIIPMFSGISSPQGDIIPVFFWDIVPV